MKHRITTDDRLRRRLQVLAQHAVPAARSELATDLREQVLERVIAETPVRTGRLRDGWRAAASGGGPDGDAGGTDSSGRSVRDATNHTPHGRYVEYGTSRQRPQRVVGVALRRVAKRAAALFRLSR